MTLDEYQAAARKTAIYPGQGTVLGLNYVALKLAGEAGEFSENFGKAIRDDGLYDVHEGGISQITIYVLPLEPSRREKLKKELSDVLWYVSQAAFELGYKLDEIATYNIAKLADRQQRGVLHGAGDDR